MEIEQSVDLISDLCLDKVDQFDWTGRSTSLFCVVAGNLSDDLQTIKHALEHLSTLYRGVFYIDGSYEHLDLSEYESTIESIQNICKPIKNVVYMHNQVVVLNNIAFIGINGWYNNSPNITCLEDAVRLEEYRTQDLGYLTSSIRNLQLHKDATKIIVVSASVPSNHLMYKDVKLKQDVPEPNLSLIMDTDNKVTHWLYSGTEIISDNVYNRRRYVNNPKIKGQPYWPKRIVI